MNKILLIILIFAILPQKDVEKDFFKYHSEFVEIEELIVNENFKQAEVELESLILEYEPKFTKDYVILAQLFLLNDNKSQSIKWLKESMKLGAKVTCLQEIELLDNRLTDSDWNELIKDADQLTDIYRSNINYSLGQHFNRNYQTEQNNKTSKNYKSIVYSNFGKILKLTEKGTFPGEYLIGIDDKEFAPKISECHFGNAKVIVTLLHFDYPIKSLKESNLVKAIKKGQLHPREFASFYTFARNEFGKLYRNSSKSGQKLSNYNFLFAFEKRNANLEQVNADRKKFGICSVEIDGMKRKIIEKYGMKLSFGYK